MHMTNFVSKIDKKLYLEESISPIKKPPCEYCKIETPEVSLQMIQTPGDDYTI